MELRQILAVLRKWWWLMLLAPAIAAFFSWLAAKDQPPVYQSSTTLMIGQVLDEVNPDYSDFYTSQQFAQTYSELVKREPILKETAAALGLGDQWRGLKGKVAVSLIPGTQLLEIRVTDTSPEWAQRLAAELARQLQKRVEPVETADRQFIRAQALDLPKKIMAAQDEIRNLEADLQGAFSAREIQDIQSQINILQAQVTSWQATFAQYQLLLGDSSPRRLEVIEEASLPAQPIGVGWLSQVLLAAAIGLILAVGAVLLLEYLDDSLKTPEDVERATGATTLGLIADIVGAAPPDKLIVLRHPRSPISEAYRVIRTNLQFSSPDRSLRLIVVTSPSPKEGKSTTTANLGVVMAQSGKKVLLVDADLRRPQLHRIFQVPNKSGLTSLLLEGAPQLDGSLQETGIENLRVLTSGPLPPNPSELLGSQRMQRLVTQLAEMADVVLFDTPPALPVTDAALLSTLADGVLVVADAGRTRRGPARQTAESLRKIGANILGVVLNRLSPGLGRYYYYYYDYQYTQGGKKRRHRRKYRLYDRVAAFIRGLLVVLIVVLVASLRMG